MDTLKKSIVSMIVGTSGIGLIIKGIFNVIKAKKEKSTNKLGAAKNDIFLGSIVVVVYLILLAVIYGVFVLIEHPKKADPIAMAVIIGNHANAMVIPDQAYAELNPLLDGVKENGYLCAIVSDSTPTETVIPSDLGKDSIIEKLRNMIADDSEVDLLQAIYEAKSALNSIDCHEIKRKTLVIIDTGISTAGDLGMAKPDFNLSDLEDPSKTVEKICSEISADVFPDLSGIEVLIIGRSDGFAPVAQPQEQSSEYESIIKHFWMYILEKACNAATVEFKSVTGCCDSNSYYETENMQTTIPYVSTIVFHYDSILRSEYKANGQNKPAYKLSSNKIESRKIGYNPIIEDFFNRDAVKLYLKPYAQDLQQFLQNYPDAKIIIAAVSSEAALGRPDSISASAKKAVAFREILLELGLEGWNNNLLILGSDSSFPLCLKPPSSAYAREITEKNAAYWFILADEENDPNFQSIVDAYYENQLNQAVADQFKTILVDIGLERYDNGH